MSRRPAEDQGGATILGSKRIYRRQPGAGGHQGGLPRTRAHRRVRIQVSAASRTQVGEGVEIPGVMFRPRARTRGQSGRQADDGVGIRDIAQGRDGRHQAGGPLGMADPRVVVIGCGRGQQETHI